MTTTNSTTPKDAQGAASGTAPKTSTAKKTPAKKRGRAATKRTKAATQAKKNAAETAAASKGNAGAPKPIETGEERREFFHDVQRAANHKVTVELDGKAWTIAQVPKGDVTHTLRLLQSHLQRVERQRG